MPDEREYLLKNGFLDDSFFADEHFFSVIAEAVSCFKSGGTLFVCGNGGSAADADHICGELLKGFMLRRGLSESEQSEFRRVFGEEGREIASKLQGGIRAVSLLSHPGFTSAFLNDVDGELSFAQQLWALGRRGDMLMGISTGGGAENVKKALITAKIMGIKTVLLTGNRHGECEKYSDTVLRVPDSRTYKIQESHIKMYHAFCAAVEYAMYGNELS